MDAFQGYLRELIEYKRVNGNLNVPPESSELYEYCEKLKNAKFDGFLRFDMITALDAIGFPWDEEDEKDEKDTYQRSIRFPEEGIQEIRKFAHKSTSPRSTTDFISNDTSNDDINDMIISFLARVLFISFNIMQHDYYIDMKQRHVKYALDIYMRNEEGPVRSSSGALLGHERDTNEVEDPTYQACDEDESASAFDEELGAEFDDDKSSDEEYDDEEDLTMNFPVDVGKSFYEEYKPLEKDIRLSNEEFKKTVVRKLSEEINYYIDIEKDVITLLNESCYSFAVGKLLARR